MKKWFSIALGVVTATGGFLDAGTIATAAESGAKFGLGLIWAIVLATLAIILLVEMVGRFTAVSKKPYAAAIREEFGFGWEWGEGKKPVEAARFNLLIIVFLCIAFIIGILGFDPLQLALFASTVIALFLPISLLPFLVIMNDPQYLGEKINGRWTNIAVMGILLMAFVVAIVSIPLELLSGGG